ncbi:MAG: tetraacyldisaccharide 4'-kinase, partial [Paracoccaceae bacterium]
EPVSVGLARADLVLSIGAADAQVQFAQRWGKWIRVPHLTGELKPLQMGMDWHGQRVLAFAGIGYPEKFFATLRNAGAEIVRAVSLDDHQPLTDTLLRRLEAEALGLGAQLVTTEKDQVRLPVAFRPKVLTMVVRLEVNDWSAVDEALSLLVTQSNF